MDGNLAAAIDVIIDPSRAVAGERQTIAALDRIIGHGKRVSAANDNTASSFDRIGRSMSGAAGKGGAIASVLDDIRGRAVGATPAVGGLIQNLMGLGPIAAIAGAAALAIGAIGSAAIRAASQTQQGLAQIETITKDAQKAKDTYAELVKFGNSTPFDTSQSVQAFVKLRQMGLAATQDRLTAFGNVAAATGKDLNQFIEAVADAGTGEFERLKEFGIKSKNQGDTIKFTMAGVTTEVKNNSVEITKYLESIGKVQYAGAMAKQMDTLKGAFSGVDDAWQQMLSGIGMGHLGTAVKDIAKSLANGISAITPLMSAVGNVVGSIISGVGAILNGLGSMWSSVNTGGQGAQSTLDGIATVLNLIADAVLFVGNTIGSAWGAAAGVINSATSAVRDYLGLNAEVAKREASWSQIGLASLELLKEGWTSARAFVVSTVASLWEDVKAGASGIGDFLAKAFSTPLDAIKGMFGDAKGVIEGTLGDLEFTPEGIITGVARTVDLMIGTFRGGIGAITVLFDQLPGAIWSSLSPGFQTIASGTWAMFKAIGTAVVTVFKSIASAGSAVATSVANVINGVIGILEKFANGAIGLINKVIAGANKLGAGMESMANVSIGRVAANTGKAELSAWDKLGADMGKAWRGGFGHEAENLTKGLIGRARGIKVGGAGGGYDAGTDVRPDAAPGSGKSGGKGKSPSSGKSAGQQLQDKLDDFWKKLEGDASDAQATYTALSAAADAGKNLATASAATAKQLEFQRLAGRDITDQEKERIANALQTQRTSKFLSDALLASDQRKFDLAEQTAVLEAKKRGLTESQLEVEKGVLKFRTDALKAGVDLTNAAYQAAEAKLRVDLSSAQAIADQNKELERQAALIEAGKDVAARYSPGAALDRQQADFKKEREQLDAWYKDKTKTGTNEAIERQYREAVQNISRAATEATTQFKTRWIDAIDQIAGSFSGRFGSIIQGFADALNRLRQQGGSNDRSLFGGIAGLFGGKVKSGYDEQGALNAGGLTAALSNPLKSLSSGFTDFKKMFTDPGQGGFGAVLGKGLAKAGAGFEMGSAIGGIGQSIFGGSFGTGSKIGGTIGGLLGPIGGIIGSIGGGLIGSLFGKKANYGTAQLTGAGDAVVSGRGSTAKSGAGGAAGSVQDGLAQLANALGGSVGDYRVSIGTYDGKWRVSTSGQTGEMSYGKKNKANWSTLHDFGDDQAAAIAYAIEDAIKDGAITGLSATIQKALNTLGTDAAIQFAKDWTAAMADYKSLIDPVGAAIDAIVKPLDTLRDTMIKVGATTEDMAKLEDYRAKKLDAALKEQTSGFRDILDQLNGSAGGFSDMALLTQNMAKLDGYRADLAAGRSVDQSAFSDLADKIISGARNLYGTQTQDYQDIVNLLRSTTTSALDQATKAFNSAAAGDTVDMSKAIADQTDAYTANQIKTNDLLAQQNGLLEEQNNLLRQQVAGANKLGVENARLIQEW